MSDAEGKPGPGEARDDEKDVQGPARFADTLKAYRYAKREQLAAEGRAPLRRELARLVHFLDDVQQEKDTGDERADEGEARSDPQLANVDVDVGFRKAKARVLREILAEAEREEA